MTFRRSIVRRGHHRHRRGCRALAHLGWALLLALLVLAPLPASLGGGGVAWAVPWPGRAPSLPKPAPRPSTNLQEQAPPLAVQQLLAALDGRQPQIRILSPADDALLPAGEWELSLQVNDWPLVEAGALGLGPHLLVMVDDQPPLPTTTTRLRLPALAPGSHRISVVAARPWGEAVKQPGAFAQVRVHRVAADPQGLPAVDAPQLIAVPPPATAAAEPILVDWLMPQAPLQNLRPEDTGWRLRLTLNGDSVLLERQHPLWLSGWRAGSNALVLELLNARGEPLNPPYTSQVLDVQLDTSAPTPRWRQGPLESEELAQLLGEAPPPPIVTEQPMAETEQPVAEESRDPAQDSAIDIAPNTSPADQPADPEEPAMPPERTARDEPVVTDAAEEPVEQGNRP